MVPRHHEAGSLLAAHPEQEKCPEGHLEVKYLIIHIIIKHQGLMCSQAKSASSHLLKLLFVSLFFPAPVPTVIRVCRLN